MAKLVTFAKRAWALPFIDQVVLFTLAWVLIDLAFVRRLSDITMLRLLGYCIVAWHWAAWLYLYGHPWWINPDAERLRLRWRGREMPARCGFIESCEETLAVFHAARDPIDGACTVSSMCADAKLGLWETMSFVETVSEEAAAACCHVVTCPACQLAVKKHLAQRQHLSLVPRRRSA